MSWVFPRLLAGHADAELTSARPGNYDPARYRLQLSICDPVSLVAICAHAGQGESMKLNFEQIIDADRQTVWAAFENPGNMTRWQQNLESYSHISGVPGQPGAKAELTYNEGSRKITLTETVTERREPDLFAGTY
jgi:hypothetical protein